MSSENPFHPLNPLFLFSAPKQSVYFREICGRIRSSKFCEFCVFCGRMLLRRGLAEGALLARLVHFLLGWCISCSVGALETSAPPKCATVRVRRPIGFRPPSDRIPFAVQSVSVRCPIGFRPPSVEKCWEKRCENVVLNGNTIGDFAIFDVSVFRCFHYPHPNRLCKSVKSVGGSLFAWLVHFLLWQAAKPSGDKCTP